MKEHIVPTYHANQIFQWMWQKNAENFAQMTNLSKNLRKTLTDEFCISGLRIEKINTTIDGVKKFLLVTEDNMQIETVFIPENRRKTICVSTQVGCPLKCKFCATGLMGFKRNLKAHEIADQVRIVQEYVNIKITNLVFMGMGEPFLNLESVIAAINIINSPIGLSISQRHITISTAGIIPGIYRLLKYPLKIKLAISLNFADQKTRCKMMPVACQNPLRELISAAKKYSLEKGMVTFEYVIIRNINDKIEHAQKLLDILKDVPSKINIIPYNPCPLLLYKKPSLIRINRFYDFLLKSSHTITLRKARGNRIQAGCGQLVSFKEC